MPSLQAEHGAQVALRRSPKAVDAGGESEFLTTDEVAGRLRVHPTTILRRLGPMDAQDPTRIPAVRVGRVWRIPKREFEEWLARSAQPGVPAGRQRRLF
jgi:hypothetical protein